MSTYPGVDREQIVAAIRSVQTSLHWKPGGGVVMTNPEERLRVYEVDVQFPEVSGMEHIEMFYNRSELAALEAELSADQKKRLARADQILVRDSRLFYAAIQSIVNLQRWREQDNASPDHWWWYLDVLTAAPIVPAAGTQATSETVLVLVSN